MWQNKEPGSYKKTQSDETKNSSHSHSVLTRSKQVGGNFQQPAFCRSVESTWPPFEVALVIWLCYITYVESTVDIALSLDNQCIAPFDQNKLQLVQGKTCLEKTQN